MYVIDSLHTRWLTQEFFREWFSKVLKIRHEFQNSCAVTRTATNFADDMRYALEFRGNVLNYSRSWKNGKSCQTRVNSSACKCSLKLKRNVLTVNCWCRLGSGALKELLWHKRRGNLGRHIRYRMTSGHVAASCRWFHTPEGHLNLPEINKRRIINIHARSRLEIHVSMQGQWMI